MQQYWNGKSLPEKVKKAVRKEVMLFVNLFYYNSFMRV